MTDDDIDEDDGPEPTAAQEKYAKGLFVALREQFERFELAEGTLDGDPCFYLAADGKPVAIVLDSETKESIDDALACRVELEEAEEDKDDDEDEKPKKKKKAKAKKGWKP